MIADIWTRLANGAAAAGVIVLIFIALVVALAASFDKDLKQ